MGLAERPLGPYRSCMAFQYEVIWCSLKALAFVAAEHLALPAFYIQHGLSSGGQYH